MREKVIGPLSRGGGGLKTLVAGPLRKDLFFRLPKENENVNKVYSLKGLFKFFLNITIDSAETAGI